MQRQMVHIHAGKLDFSVPVAEVPRDLPLSEILRRANLPLNTRCGRRGLCDGCVIELLQGQVQHLGSSEMISANGQPLSLRGCEHSLGDTGADPADIRIKIPPRALLRYEPRVVSDFRINIPGSHDPLLPASPTAAGPALAAAVDVGTTTVAVLLVDLADGRIVSRAAGFNRQMQCGDDVLTRINLCGDKAMLRQLQHAVAKETIARLLGEAVAEAGGDAQQLRGICFAGNSTMLHLLLGIDPTPMGISPFTPAFLEHRVVEAAEIFGPSMNDVLPLDPQMPCHLLPGAAAYVGADLVAGVLASGLLYDPGPSLLVDVGTNGEIILKQDGQMSGCATAAGPAFEGAGLSCGMRAGDGAVSTVRISEDAAELEIDWIGRERGARPVGICGSAYVDFLSQARTAALLTPTGRYDMRQLPAGARKRLVPWNGHDFGYRLARGPGGVPIVITQRDISRLLQAKAAIAAGIITLLQHHGIRPDQVRTLYLAGGFGTHLHRESAIRCGLLPGLAPEQIQSIGNSALAGAYLAILDRGLLDEAERAARSIEVIELNEQPEFEALYIDNLLL